AGEERRAAVHGHRELAHVDVELRELRARLAGGGGDRLAPDVDAAAVAAVGQVHEVAAGGERPPVVSGPVGERGERAGRAVEHPHVALVRALVGAPAPGASAALHDDGLAVGRGDGMSAEGVGDALDRPAVERHHEGARGAVEV
ncbi:MAG: hypothetical protein ACK55I_21770, partial [bacterium]